MFSIVQVILALTLQVSLRRIKKILVAGYFDDLITMNITHGSSWENILKITFIKTRLCYTPSESSFQPCQEIAYLKFAITSIKVRV